METDDAGFIKQREIFFVELHPDPNQAQTAALMLSDVDGVLQVQPESPIYLQISYDLMLVSLEQIEAGLTAVGLHLDNRLIYRLKRALFYYTEETFRANRGCPRGESNCTREIFANRYQRLNHECRDRRPEHWRKYL